MKIYAVTFPTDTPALKCLMKNNRKEILLSYFFLKQSPPLSDIIEKIEKELL